MGNCGTQCLKYLLFVFNFLVGLAGIAILGFSVYVLIDSADFQKIVNSEGLHPAFLTIWMIFGVGVALFFLGIMGFYGSKHENRCLLALYFFLIFVVFVVEIVAGVMSLIFYPELKGAAIDTTNLYGLQEVSTNYSEWTGDRKDMSQDITQYWDFFQSKAKCCGFSHVEDWNNSTYFKITERYPPSCCDKGDFDKVFQDNNVVNGSCTFQEVENYTDHLSCTDQAKNNIKILGGVALGVLFLEFISMLSSCCMYRSLQEDF